uniref:E3 ubiquitin-protein ligase RNF186 isoform X2 n=1 Tax=Myxine glutinosa TaxID=7769 RepID=UPI00358DF92D
MPRTSSDDVITKSPTCEFGCAPCADPHVPPPGRRQTRVLPCGHAYCAPCSLRLVCVERGVPAVRCPLCRRLSFLGRPLVDVLTMLQEPIRHAGHQDASSMSKQAAVPPVHRLELVLPRFKFLHIFKKVSYEKLK